jgi:hypothetical protein
MAKSKKEANKPDFVWGETLPCVATYKVLESASPFMDQFEDSDVPFDEAGTLKIGQLRFFPHATTNSQILELLSLQMAQKFMTLIQKNFTIAPHQQGTSAAKVIRAVAKIFADPDQTLTALASTVNDNIDFPQPVG